jgi:type IV pilus assembly protein PilQ
LHNHIHPLLHLFFAEAENLAAEQKAQAGQQTAAVGPKYTGEPISVNLKDVDLRDFFRLIHEISGLNVVLDPAVKGTLTIVLDEVPWDQGLDIVLRNNGLTKEIDRKVFWKLVKMIPVLVVTQARSLLFFGPGWVIGDSLWPPGTGLESS